MSGVVSGMAFEEVSRLEGEVERLTAAVVCLVEASAAAAAREKALREITGQMREADEWRDEQELILDLWDRRAGKVT